MLRTYCILGKALDQLHWDRAPSAVLGPFVSLLVEVEIDSRLINQFVLHSGILSKVRNYIWILLWFISSWIRNCLSFFCFHPCYFLFCFIAAFFAPVFVSATEESAYA